MLTLCKREPTSTRKQPGKGHADYLLAICQVRARARVSVLCVCACVHRRACVYWKSLCTEEEEPYEHRLYSLETTSSNLPRHTDTVSPADTAATFLRSGKKPTHFFGYFFWILMPELITNLALLSGSLRIFSFGDERLQCGAEHFCEVS